MTSYRFPTVFLSHGTPMHAHGEDRYQETLLAFANSMPKPKAVVIVSAHSVSAEHIHVLKTPLNTIHHDFHGFPADLYKFQYSCPGSPELADQIIKNLTEAGFETRTELNAPLDHGIWIPLSHLYPKGDVPVVRLSLPLGLEPTKILKMGQTLAFLREQGVMIAASGGAVHNLKELKWAEKHGTGAEWAHQYEEFLVLALQNKDVEAILHSEELPFFAKAHPSLEHFLPLIFSIGAALPKDQVTILYRGIEYGSLSMLCFTLNHAQTHVQNQSLH
jgi:4,5-DOPA dioxygenase extradiol